MLTIDEVRALAVAEGLAEFAGSLIDTVRPGWRLDVHDRAEASLGASKIGGDPDLVVSESWPTNHRGVPMTFLAQVNGDELPALAPEWATSATRLPRGLLLRVFADLVDEPYDPGVARVLAATIPAELVRTPAPDLPRGRIGSGWTVATSTRTPMTAACRGRFTTCSVKNPLNRSPPASTWRPWFSTRAMTHGSGPTRP